MAIRFCALDTEKVSLKQYHALSKEEKRRLSYDKTIVIEDEAGCFCGIVNAKDADSDHINKLSVKIGTDVFAKANDIFFDNRRLDFLPVINECDKIICFCYQDYDLEKMKENCLELLTFNNISGFEEMISKGKIVKICGISEIAYYFHLLLKKQSVKHYVCGDLWEYLSPEYIYQKNCDDCDFLFFLAEGNYGIPIADSAYGKTVLEWQKDDFKLLYDFYYLNCIYNNVLTKEEMQNRIKKDLLSCRPFMLARIGNTELSILKEYLEKKKGLVSHYSPFWMEYLYDCCGFFSDNHGSWNEKDVDMYAELTLQALRECDFQVCWGNEDLAAGLNFVLEEYESPSSCRVSWDDLETSACCYQKTEQKNFLQGKTVLVISPFVDTIEKQYNLRAQIHDVEHRMPECNLIFLRAPQTVMGNTEGYHNWFESYHNLCEKLARIDFDVALIGAGSYGFPLAAKIKSMGKQAFSLSSYLPNWFGIKMKRYCAYAPINRYWNDNWCFPMETPPRGYEKIEDGCYWR